MCFSSRFGCLLDANFASLSADTTDTNKLILVLDDELADWFLDWEGMNCYPELVFATLGKTLVRFKVALGLAHESFVEKG